MKLWRATTVKCEHLLSCALKLLLFVSPISCCDAACFAILTFSEPIQKLVMKVSRGRVICHGTCALQFYDEGSMFFYSALLKFSY